MSAKDGVDVAQALADKLGAACTDAMLDWGEAINDYEATPESDSTKKLKLTITQMQGQRVMDLSVKLASKLRPRVG